MTYYQMALLDEAKEYWRLDRVVPLILFAKLAQEGFDVAELEIKYRP